MFHGIDILAHISHINSCQIPVDFILLIFDLPIGTSRSKTKTKMGFLKWYLHFKNGPPFLSFGGFQKRVSLVPYWNEESETKTKTPFLFLFLTSLLERPKRAFDEFKTRWIPPVPLVYPQPAGNFFLMNSQICKI